MNAFIDTIRSQSKGTPFMQKGQVARCTSLERLSGATETLVALAGFACFLVPDTVADFLDDNDT